MVTTLFQRSVALKIVLCDITLMLSGDGNKSSPPPPPKKKISGSNYQKTLQVPRALFFLFCTFPCRCFARLQRETSINFIVRRFTCVVEMLNVFLFTFFFLIAAVNFIPSWWPLPFLILSNIFMLFFQRNWFPLFLISRALALSPLSTSMETLKLCRKK